MYCYFPSESVPKCFDVWESVAVPACESLETLNVGCDFVLCSELYEYPGPLDRVQGVQNHHGSLGVPVFLFLLDQCVVAGVDGECLV